MMLKINKERLARRIEELSKFGGSELGMNRFVYTIEEEAALNYLQGIFKELGLKVRVDAVGNLFARYEGTEPQLKPIVSGSHIDSVRNGGKYDGNLGVLSALEVIERLHEEAIRLKHPLELFISKDEEGTRYGSTMFGTAAMIGGVTPADLTNRVDADGISLEEAIRNAGYAPDDLASAVIQPGSLAAYVELHIEQAVVLESEVIPIGIVTGIAGPCWISVTIKGEAGHAGATPMRIRHDPMVAASRLIVETDRIARQYQDTVATTGLIKIDPGTTNVIPREVYYTIDLRDVNMDHRNLAEKQIRDYAKILESELGVTIEFSDLVRVDSVPCSHQIMAIIEDVSQELGLKSLRVPSGACHDAMHFGDICPFGMIFVPSVKGYSHRADEFTSVEDCANGADVLLQTIRKLDEKI